MTRIATLALLLVAPALCGGAQTSLVSIELEETVGGPGLDVGNAIVELENGGFAVIGYQDNGEGRGTDAILIRLDPAGETLWSKAYGGGGADFGWDLAETEDGGFLVTGFTNDTESGEDDVWMFGVDRRGELLWERTVGGAQGERAWALEPTPDGGAVIAAQTQSWGAGDWDLLLLRVDASGETIWRRVHGEAGVDRVFDVAITPNRDFVFVGTKAAGPDAPRNALIVRTSPSGEIQWERTHGGSDDDVGHGILARDDGHLLATGYGRSFGAGDYDVYLMHLDENGTLLRRDVIGGASDDRAMMSVVTPNSRFVTVGYTGRHGTWDIYLLETDESGRLIWEQVMRRPGRDRGVMVLRARDESLFVTGALNRADAGPPNIGWILFQRDDVVRSPTREEGRPLQVTAPPRQR